MPELDAPRPERQTEEEASRTSDFLKDQMDYLKSRFAHERRKLEERTFARRRD